MNLDHSLVGKTVHGSTAMPLAEVYRVSFSREFQRLSVGGGRYIFGDLINVKYRGVGGCHDRSLQSFFREIRNG